MASPSITLNRHRTQDRLASHCVLQRYHRICHSLTIAGHGPSSVITVAHCSERSVDAGHAAGIHHMHICFSAWQLLQTMNLGLSASMRAIACAARSSLVPRYFACPISNLNSATGQFGASMHQRRVYV